MYEILEMLRSGGARKQSREEIDGRMRRSVPWTPNTRWAKELNIKGSTYEMPGLFDGLKPVHPFVDDEDSGGVVMSPCGQWRYTLRKLPAGCLLSLHGRNGQRGSVVFDSDVNIPVLNKLWLGTPSAVVKMAKDWPISAQWSAFLGGMFSPTGDACPFMSLTPNEIISLRPGTRMAKGHVAIGGLGMGYQLIEVSKRKNVERITVAEIDKSLIDWLMPVIREKLGPVPVDVIHGDVFKVFGPPFEADVCLLDVYPKMGSNTAGPLSGNPGLKKIWVWGAERKERGRAFISSRAV